MNINAAIIDQRSNQIVEEIRTEAATRFNITDAGRLKSLAFVFWCVKKLLDLETEEVLDTLTEGGQDFGVDALHIADEQDGEFTVTLFQAKYNRDLSGNSNFPETGIKSLVNAIRYLFDPNADVTLNPALRPKVEDVRSRIREGLLPRIRAVLCNNGLKWNSEGQAHINRADFGSQVTWEYLNHDGLVGIMQAPKIVTDTLLLSGKAVVEDFNYSRVLIGKISVEEIAALMERHGERLLERNIRRYLGLQGNRVNEAIRATLGQPQEQPNFYFYNNGVTLTCAKFDYNALQSGDYQVRVENLQIINGGQTCMTIFRTLRDELPILGDHLDQAFIMVRLYQLPADQEDFIRNITYATNNQNPVDLRDLRANDERQKRLTLAIKELGFSYRPKRAETAGKPEEITSGTAAEAVLSVWRRRPHQAKFLAREHFGKLYDEIFTSTLNGAQVIVATLIYRIAENKRKRPGPDAPDFIPYASCFLAMQMGRRLLADMGLKSVEQLDHRNLPDARQRIEGQGEAYLEQAITEVDQALKRLYGSQRTSLQRLSATFRRADLIDELDAIAREPA